VITRERRASWRQSCVETSTADGRVEDLAGVADGGATRVILKPAEQVRRSPPVPAELAPRAGQSRRCGQRAAGLRRDQPGQGARPAKWTSTYRLHRARPSVGKVSSCATPAREQKAGVAGVRGKSPNIVLGDGRAQPRNSPPGEPLRAYGFNQGEVCTAGSRLIVEGQDQGPVPRDGRWRIEPEDDAGRSAEPKTQMAAMVDGPRPSASWVHRGRQERSAKLRMGGSQVHVDNDGRFIERTCSTAVRQTKMKSPRRKY